MLLPLQLLTDFISHISLKGVRVGVTDIVDKVTMQMLLKIH